MFKSKKIKGNKSNGKVIISKEGPYIISGNLPLVREEIVYNSVGEPFKWYMSKKYSNLKVCSLCRDGKSSNKPFCGGTDIRKCLDGLETASRNPL